MTDHTYRFKCGTCNASRKHRYDYDKEHYLCETCGASHTLAVDREAYERQKNREAHEALAQIYNYYCARCNGVRKHRLRVVDYAENYWACAGCGASNVLPRAASALPTPLETGPWEGYSVCATCKCGLHENRYFANNSVCPHCGASYMGTTVVVRRPVFSIPARQHTWWKRLAAWCSGKELKEVPFRWEIKETDDRE